MQASAKSIRPGLPGGCGVSLARLAVPAGAACAHRADPGEPGRAGDRRERPRRGGVCRLGRPQAEPERRPDPAPQVPHALVVPAAAAAGDLQAAMPRRLSARRSVSYERLAAAPARSAHSGRAAPLSHGCGSSGGRGRATGLIASHAPAAGTSSGAPASPAPRRPRAGRRTQPRRCGSGVAGTRRLLT